MAVVFTLVATCLLNACALEPGNEAASYTAGIDITLTPLDVFGTGGTSTTQPGAGGAQLGYAAAVAASGGFVYVVDAVSSALVQLDPARAELRVLYPLRDPNTSGLHVSMDQVIDILKDQPRIPYDVAVTIIHEVCLGLEAAHAKVGGKRV